VLDSAWHGSKLFRAVIKPPLHSFADHGDENFPPVSGAAMFEQEHALPCAELHFSTDYRHSFTGARQYHADMRWHIIAAFGTVREINGVFRHEPLEKLFQVAARSRIGIFHDDDAATGVLNEKSYCPHLHSRPVDLRLHFLGDFVKTLAVSPDFKLVVGDVHREGILCMRDHESKTRLGTRPRRSFITIAR